MGEHSPVLRAAAAARLGHLGVELAATARSTSAADADITADGARARTVVVTAAEDVEVARETRAVLGAQ